VIELLDGRDRRIVERWLSALPADVRARIEVVSIDPYDGYRQAIRAALPHARIVCDHFPSCPAPIRRWMRCAAIARVRPRRGPKGVRRNRQHAAWRPISTTPATASSMRANASANATADARASCSSASR
jgi:transposase